MSSLALYAWCIYVDLTVTSSKLIDYRSSPFWGIVVSTPYNIIFIYPPDNVLGFAVVSERHTLNAYIKFTGLPITSQKAGFSLFQRRFSYSNSMKNCKTSLNQSKKQKCVGSPGCIPGWYEMFPVINPIDTYFYLTT